MKGRRFDVFLQFRKQEFCKHKLEIDNRYTVESTQDIVFETTSLYERLHSSKEHVLKDCDPESLSEGDLYELSKGDDSEDELLKCLKRAKNNKSPGSDGFAYNFYNFF